MKIELTIFLGGLFLQHKFHATLEFQVLTRVWQNQFLLRLTKVQLDLQVHGGIWPKKFEDKINVQN